MGSFNNLWGFLKWRVQKLDEVWLVMGQILGKKFDGGRKSTLLQKKFLQQLKGNLT